MIDSQGIVLYVMCMFCMRRLCLGKLDVVACIIVESFEKYLS